MLKDNAGGGIGVCAWCVLVLQGGDTKDAPSHFLALESNSENIFSPFVN